MHENKLNICEKQQRWKWERIQVEFLKKRGIVSLLPLLPIETSYSVLVVCKFCRSFFIAERIASSLEFLIIGLQLRLGLVYRPKRPSF